MENQQIEKVDEVQEKKKYTYSAEYRKAKNKIYYDSHRDKILNYHKTVVNNQPKEHKRKGRGLGKKTIDINSDEVLLKIYNMLKLKLKL